MAIRLFVFFIANVTKVKFSRLTGASLKIKNEFF
jgi:hypothetical protein